MALLQQRLARAGLRARLVSITVDPERDTATALERYAAAVGADRARWHFLRDEPALLAPVLAAWDEWARRERDGGIDHPARLHLVDARGDVHEIYALAFFDERQAELDIRALLREPRHSLTEGSGSTRSAGLPDGVSSACRRRMKGSRSRIAKKVMESTQNSSA
jgi:cytochrome oxidase Cu insertion factor (SCO1/SenC/PrrC family)